MDNNILCGGEETEDSCLKWSPDTGTWEELLTLDIERYGHVSWTPSTDVGTYLIGGGSNISTLITPAGTQETGFELKHSPLFGMCAIPETDTVVITGEGDDLNMVSRYNVLGWQEDLPLLSQGRNAHACADYTSDGRRVRI